MVYSKVKHVLIVVVPWVLFFIVDIVKKPWLDFKDEFFLWYYLPGYLLWMALTLPIYRIFIWSSRLPQWKRVPSLLLLGLSIGLSKVTLNKGIYTLISMLYNGSASIFGPPRMIGRSTFYFTEASIIAWVLLVVFFVIELNRKYRTKAIEAAQLESALATANLQALKMQIHPHFLFNAHNTIATLMRSNRNDHALEMLLKLSDLLRISLNNFDNQLVPLSQEIAFTRKYLDIERVRFEDSLIVDYDIPDDAKDVLIPVFILQPLVENAIKHGVNKTIGVSKILISAKKDPINLQLEVFNSGGLLENTSTPTGIGIDNTRKRLRSLYKGDANVRLKEVTDGVSASITFPLKIHLTTPGP